MLHALTSPAPAELHAIPAKAAAAARAEQELAADPLVLAEALNTLGYTYFQLAIYDQAESLLLRALEAVRRDAGEHSAAMKSVSGKLALFYDQWGRPEAAARYRTP